MLIQQPHRVSRTYTQHLCADPGKVFPLLCPVRETEWLEYWDPRTVITASGVVEPDCVFISEKPQPALWYVIRHEPEAGVLECLRITPDITACRLNIHVTAAHGGSEARITFTHTSLGPEGETFVASFTEDHYRAFMQDWEGRMNHFLKTGTMLRGEGHA